MATIATGNKRLLRLAKILDTVDERHQEKGEPTYTQMFYAHENCGVPSCALGHWDAAVHPERFNAKCGGRDMRHAMEEFGLSEAQEEMLFSQHGCGKARNAKEAAEYIRAFVALREQRPVNQ